MSRNSFTANLARTMLALIRVAAFALIVTLWRWVLQQQFPAPVTFLCIVGTVLAVFPTVWIGRKLLDRYPTTEHAAWITSGVHAILMVLFGIAIIKAVQTGDHWQGWVVPFPRSIGIILVYITGTLMLLTVINLALEGLGAPFALALSRRLAKNWLYARTRNPMVLATLSWLITMGLWLQSTLFVLWVLALVAPAWIAFLKGYEERELEIRFGEAYRTYKAKTPFLWPG